MNNTVINGLSHSFVNKARSIKVIDEFSLTVVENETIAILGPSGCGKSTILRCIAGFIEPLFGHITINGNSSEFASKNKMVGFAFQDAALLEWKTVMENILLPGKIGKPSGDNDILINKANSLIDLMHLQGFEDYFPNQLSGGMKQRVALARAFLLEPSLLLLDEPFGSLDLLTRSNLIVEFSKILQYNGTPTIIVTHSIEEAVFLADKVYILSPRPAKIVSIIEPMLSKKKELSYFENPDFIMNVSECRKTLMEHWNYYEN